jgi:hypothetical protein
VVIVTRPNVTRLLMGPAQAIAVGPNGVDKPKEGIDIKIVSERLNHSSTHLA